MEAPITASRLDAEQQRVVRWCLWTLATLGTASMVGAAFSLYLVTHHPLLLIALSPLGRHLLLAAPSVDPVAFVAVGTARRLAFYLACFQLGRALGPLGIPWIEARAARFARLVRWLERLFERAARTVVLVMSGPTVAALAGISGMRTRVFVPLATASLVVRMLIVLFFAEALRSYLEIALAWIEAHWVPGTIVMVALVLVYRWRRRAPLGVFED
jgi:membrane protein DedA with SNARE-associated domain